MPKVRYTNDGHIGQTQYRYLNGNVYQTVVGLSADYAGKSILEISQGHPYGALKPKSKPRRPKPYRGKNPAKQARAIAIAAEYGRRLVRWQFGKEADIGGPFQTRTIRHYPACKYIEDTYNWGSGFVWVDKGRYSAGSSTSSVITVNPSSNSELDAYGASCIAKCLPTNPISNMGQFLVELRDFPSMINPRSWEHRADKFRSLAANGSSEYLNAAFGWYPFLSDIFDFFDTTLEFNKHITQYARDSGRHVRRNAKLFDRTTTVSTPVGIPGLMAPSPNPNLIQQGGSVNEDVVTRHRVWFKGSFTYYLPKPGFDFQSNFARYRAYARKLYGLDLTPDLLWKVTPWTWAVDWVTNTGSIIRNWDAFHNQGLVMHYGYVMEEKTVTTKRSLTGFRLASNPTTSLIDYTVEQCKVRRRATPYGFGANPASFSPFQLGIITALGINRAAKWL